MFLQNLATSYVNQMWIKGGTYANINGSPEDPYNKGYDVNGVRVMSCVLEQDGHLNFGYNTPLDEQLWFAKLCAKAEAYERGPPISNTQRIASIQAANELINEIMCQQKSYKGDQKCMRVQKVVISGDQADAYKQWLAMQAGKQIILII